MNWNFLLSTIFLQSIQTHKSCWQGLSPLHFNFLGIDMRPYTWRVLGNCIEHRSFKFTFGVLLSSLFFRCTLLFIKCHIRCVQFYRMTGYLGMTALEHRMVKQRLTRGERVFAEHVFLINRPDKRQGPCTHAPFTCAHLVSWFGRRCSDTSRNGALATTRNLVLGLGLKDRQN